MDSNFFYKKRFLMVFSFFAMVFVGLAANCIKSDFHLTDIMVSLFSSMAFFCFLIRIVPMGVLMNRIGQRKTALLLSLVVMLLALLLLIVDHDFATRLLSFSDIGNVLMQVSFNPLFSSIVIDNWLVRSFALGQFVERTASFVTPLIAGWAMMSIGVLLLFFAVRRVSSVNSLLNKSVKR